MDELLDSLLTWRHGTLVPLSSLPSIIALRASPPDRCKGESAASPSRQEVVQRFDLPTSSTRRPWRVPSSNPGNLADEQAMTAATYPWKWEADEETLSSLQPHGNVDAEEKKLSRIYTDSLYCQDLVQAPPYNSGVGLQPCINKVQTSQAQRFSESSYGGRIQPPKRARRRSGQYTVTARHPLASMDAIPPPHVDGLDMMSIDDFEKAHPFTPPPAKMINLTSTGDGASTDLFNMACQAKGLTPYFTYVEPSKGSFLATAHVDNQALEQAGPYASKKAAKEAACQAAMSKLEALPNKVDLKRAEAQKSLPTLRTLNGNTGEHGSKMNMICQQKKLVSDITYAEPSKGCFSAALKIDGELIEEVGLFANKKDAKEELCKVAYPKLLQFGSRKKRKSIDTSEELGDAPEILKEENWVGTLVEHCQHSKIQYPVYNETGPHPSHGPFSCSVHFDGSPPSGFGSTAGPFKKKADAKKNAAMEAVLWLRHQGQLAGGPSSKRRKSSTTGGGENAPPAGQDTGLTQSFSDAMDINGGPEYAGSIGKQVQDLCLRLGFTNPTFELVPLSDSFYNVHAIFAPQDARYEPRLVGPVAPMYNVHGKKTAKNECWAGLWKVLEEIRISREK